MKAARRIRIESVALLAAACLTSCSGYVTRGRSLYQEGRYIESAEVLARYEREIVGEPMRMQAEYATYRGLATLVLGDLMEARRWMQYAYSIEHRHPGVLRPEMRRDLDRGWGQLLASSRPRPRLAR